MALDGSILGNMASAQMEALERDYGENDSFEIGAAITIVQILQRDADGNIIGANIRKRHNIGDPFAAVGILEVAKAQVMETFSGPIESG
jgi:hypothetical protein